ncbi:MAG: TonB family protein [bacterium]
MIESKKTNSYFKNGLRFSLLLHSTFFLWLVAHWVVSAVMGPTDAEKRLLLNKQSIRVDVVDLPSLKMQDLYKVDLTKEAATEAPSKVSKKEKEVEAIAPPSSPKAMKLPEEGKSSKKTRLKELQKTFRAEAKRQELLAKYKKQVSATSGDKRPLLGGNILSKGGSVQGDVAGEEDEFKASVKAHVLKFWTSPPSAMGQGYKAQIAVKISPAGRVLSKKIIKSSGRPDFDTSAMDAIEAADPFPAPPENLKRIILQEGVVCGFPD